MGPFGNVGGLMGAWQGWGLMGAFWQVGGIDGGLAGLVD